MRPSILRHFGAALLLLLASATAAQAPEAPPSAAALRKTLTLEFRDAPLRSVFELIARSAGLNFVFDREVRTDQKASISLREASVQSALELLLLTQQLEYRMVDAATVLVYPASPAKQKEYQPLSVRSFYLAHAEAKAVGATLRQLLKLREIVTDDKLNLLLVRDTPEAIRLAEKLVALHDLPEAEVLLDVEVLEVKRSRLLELGIRWPDQVTLAPLPSASGQPLTVDDLRGLSGRTVGVTVAPAAAAARLADGHANILANPRIRARNREKARILIGERVPNITTTSTSTGFVAESVNYVDVGLKLDVEPTVSVDGDVALKVALEVSNIISQLQTKSGSVAYRIGTRSAQSVLRLRDGENQLLAGLINDHDRRSASKLPGLGELPFVGRLFGLQSDDASRTEIVLSITPRVLRQLPRPAEPLLQFDSGTEARPGMGALRMIAPATPEPASAPKPSGPPETAGPALPAGAPNPPRPSPARPPAEPALPGAAAEPTPTVAPASEARFAWEGPAALRVGDTVRVQLRVQPAVPLAALALTLGFDPTVLQVLDVRPGPMIAAEALTRRIDPAGQVQATVAAPITGAAELLQLTLRAIAPAAQGSTALQLLAAAPTASDARALGVVRPAPHALQVRP